MLFDKFALTAQQIVNKKLFTWGLNTAGQLGYTNIPTSFAQISAGQSHTLAITNTGLLYAWGLGTSGQLGDSTAVTKSSPVLVSGSITNWKQVTTGDTFSLGITTDGKLYAWGNNANSQLGNIATVNRSAPLQIGITSWTQVTAGTNHVLAIASNGLLYGWGLNNIGQVGAIANYSQSWSQISVGPSHVTAIRDNGLLFAWGLNSAGQLGDFTAISKSSPVQIGGASTWSKVSSGNNFTLAIKTNGSLWGWGLNTSYQLGDNTQTNRNSPVQISVGRSFINVAAGFDHSLAIDTSSNLYTWGNSTSISVYLFPPSTTFSWTQVSKGSSYTAAIRSDGKLFTWGLNSSGQLGDGTTITRSSPVQIGTGSWVKISAGSSHMAAINFDNSWLTWGLGTSGQLGDNTIVSKSSPVQIGVGSWTNVSAGNNFTTAISSDGKLYASGINASSQLGDGTTINKSAPVQLSATVPSTSWSQISAGFDHSLAIDNQGIMYSWGKYASIGPVSTEPTKLNSWTRVSTGDRHTLAINNDGKLFAWGVNTSGQMGVGSTGATVFSSPVQVGTANSWTSVCAGSLASIGIANDTLYGWGRNFGAGALGQGSIATGYYFTPVTMPTYPGVPSVLAVGDDVTMVINTLGQLWTCGSNGFGQLGNGSAISRSSAVQVSGSWTSVSIQQAVAVGLSNGVAYAWGSGSNGALGDGTTINKSAPVQIGTGPYVKAYATGANIYLIDSLARMYATGSSSSIPDGTAISKSTPVQISGSWASVGINTGSGGRTLGIKTDGTLWEWGLGATNPNTPTQIGSRTDWSLTVQPAASSQFATPTATLFSAVDNSGSLYQWGINADNSGGATGPISNTIPTLIGNNTPNSGNSPYYIDNANSYTQISAGTSFSLAIRNNSTLYAWGLNSSGQLGTNNTTNLNVVTQIGLVNTSSWTQISAGVSTATVIGNDGTLWVWGSNASGQLGDGTTINKSLPVQIAGSWTLVSTGINSTGAIKSDSTLYGWGSGTAGETGDSANVSKSSPVLIGNIPNLNQPTIPTLVVGNSWSQISVGTSYQLATDANNNLYTWGLNSSGQLGLGTDTIARSNPVFIRSNTVQISAGTSHAALINNVGELYAWGLNSIGQLGDNSSITKSSPVQIGIGTSWNVVAAGSTNTIATRNDGTLFAWGQNLNGEIGNNTNIVNSNPVQIGNLSWSVVGAQGSTTAGITSNGNAYLWGSNGSGSVGDVTAVTKSSPVQLGNNSVSASSPVQVVSGGVAGSWLQVSAAANYTVGIDVNYKLYAWGENTLGKLGDNSSDRRNSPVLINETNSWLLVNAGLNHAFAITYDNSLYGWGRNTEGQVGDSTTINKSVPVLLAGPSAYKNISAGNNNSAGIGINNLLYGWGNNSTGQLGLADTLNRSSPTQIGTSSWTQVSIGGTQTQGILIDRTLYAWGTNTNGTLGVNDTINRSSPILIGATALVSQSSPTQLGALSWSKISSSISHTLAIRSDGLLYGWGLNSSGQLGLVSDTIARSSPTQLGTGSSWKFVAAGLAHSLAVKSDNTLWAWFSTVADN